MSDPPGRSVIAAFKEYRHISTEDMLYAEKHEIFVF